MHLLESDRKYMTYAGVDMYDVFTVLEGTYSGVTCVKISVDTENSTDAGLVIDDPKGDWVDVIDNIPAEVKVVLVPGLKLTVVRV